MPRPKKNPEDLCVPKTYSATAVQHAALKALLLDLKGKAKDSYPDGVDLTKPIQSTRLPRRCGECNQFTCVCLPPNFPRKGRSLRDIAGWRNSLQPSVTSKPTWGEVIRARAEQNIRHYFEDSAALESFRLSGIREPESELQEEKSPAEEVK